jgi:hypothetical protein
MQQDNMTSISSYAKIIITVQRAETDDVLAITPDLDSDGYYVSFDQKSIRNKSHCYFNNTQLVDYLHIFFHTLLYDSETPRYIQIDCPMFPTVLFPPSQMENYFLLLQRQLAIVQEDWPFETLH